MTPAALRRLQSLTEARRAAALARLESLQLEDRRIAEVIVELAAMPEPKRRRAIAAWLREQGIEVTREAIRGVDNLCTQWHGQGGVAVSAAAGHEGRGEKVGTRLEVFRVGGTLSLLPRSSKERSRARQS